tara:strand:- start:331 stop:471 length:141 start_codon:yes stop_codon:yes gene_type:complete
MFADVVHVEAANNLLIVITILNVVLVENTIAQSKVQNHSPLILLLV